MVLKAIPHRSHLNGRSFVCRRMCFSSTDGLLQFIEQYGHTYRPVGVTVTVAGPLLFAATVGDAWLELIMVVVDAAAALLLLLLFAVVLVLKSVPDPAVGGDGEPEDAPEDEEMADRTGIGVIAPPPPPAAPFTYSSAEG